jgi:hypothetical protein
VKLPVRHVKQMAHVFNASQATFHYQCVTFHVLEMVLLTKTEFVYVTVALQDSTVKMSVIVSVNVVREMIICSVPSAMVPKLVTDVTNARATSIHSITVMYVFQVISTKAKMIRTVSTSVVTELYQRTS